MKPIHQILEKTPDAYEATVFEHYLRWCIQNSVDENDCQRLVANAALFDWWQREFRHLEGEFREEIGPYIETASKQEKTFAYLRSAIQVNRYRCPSLMYKARKLKIENHVHQN